MTLIHRYKWCKKMIIYVDDYIKQINTHFNISKFKSIITFKEQVLRYTNFKYLKSFHS